MVGFDGLADYQEMCRILRYKMLKKNKVRVTFRWSHNTMLGQMENYSLEVRQFSHLIEGFLYLNFLSLSRL